MTRAPRRRVALLALACLAFALSPLAGCAPSRTPHAGAERTTTRDTLLAAMRDYDRWLLGMKADSIASVYTPDGVMVSVRDTIARGPEAIAKFLHTFDGKAQVLTDTSAVDSVVINGGHAILLGIYSQKAMLLPERRVVNATGIFHATWVRSDDGVWRLRSMQTEPLR